MDYFSLLGLVPQFDIDPKTLEAAYFSAQREHHPDRKPAAERVTALTRAGDINAAYETLKNPLKRAQYLLSLQGIMVGTESDSIKPSPELLQETMEWREEIAEAAPQELAKIENSLKAMQEKSIVLIASKYIESQWKMMAEETLRLSYIGKALAAVRQRKKP